METAHAVGMDYQEDPYREARLAVAISSLEVPSICDSADRSPTQRYGGNQVVSCCQTLVASPLSLTVGTHGERGSGTLP